MACLESAIFSIDLDDDNNMYQEGGGKMETQAVAIQKKLLEIAVNSVNKMKTQMNEAGAKQKKLLEMAVNSVNEMNTQMDEAKKKEGASEREREREREREKQREIREIEAKRLLLSGVFKTAVEMKEESDMVLLKSLSQKVAKKFTDRLYKTLKKTEEQKEKEIQKYAQNCLSHFKTKYKEVKLNYPQLYSCLESDKLLNELLSKVDNPTN